MQTKEQTIIIHFNKGFFARSLKLLSLILLIGGIITLFIIIKSLLFTFVVSILLAFLLEPVVLTIESHDIKRMFAIFIVFASIAAIIAIGVFFTFPLIKPEIQTISSHLQLKHPSVFAEEFATAVENNFPLIKQHGFSYDLTKYIHQVMDDLLKESFEIVFEFVHFVSLIFLVPVFTFFLLKDGRRLKKTIIQFVPNRYFEMTLNMVYKMNQQIGSYIRGQLLDAIIVGILSIITLSLLNIRYSFLIGSVAGCANIIPHFGPIVGAVPAIIIALMETGSFTMALIITASFAIIQLLDYLFISHIVVFKHIHMHPLMVVIIVFIGGYFMGVLGMFIAVMLAGIIKLIITELTWSFKHYRIFRQPELTPVENKHN